MSLIKLAIATGFLAMIAATPVVADTRVSLNCNIDNFSPLDRYIDAHLRSWVTENILIDISDSDLVRVRFASGARARGEVTRETPNKIVMEAVRAVRSTTGHETHMTFTLEWFKSNNKIFIDVIPQGYAPMGTAKGNCGAASLRR